jgi:hypothetical protein
MRLLIAVLLAAGSVLAAPMSAQADTPRCVTRVEFRQVHDGMPLAQVHRIFNTAGHQSSVIIVGGQRHIARNYRACHRPRQSFVQVHYADGVVVAKFAIFV